MTLKNWFVSVATVGHATAARFADVSVEDIHEAAEAAGFGRRLTFSQVEEIVASLDEDQDLDPDDVESDEGAEEDEEP